MTYASSLIFNYVPDYMDGTTDVGQVLAFQDSVTQSPGSGYNAYIKVSVTKLTTRLVLDGLDSFTAQDPTAYASVGGALLPLQLDLDSALPTGTTVQLNIDTGDDQVALWDSPTISTANLILGTPDTTTTPVQSKSWTIGTDTIPAYLYVQAIQGGSTFPVIHYTLLVTPEGATQPATAPATQKNMDFDVTPYRPNVQNLGAEKIDGAADGMTVGIRNNQGTAGENFNMIRVDLHDLVSTSTSLRISRDNNNFDIYTGSNADPNAGKRTENGLLTGSTSGYVTLTVNSKGDATVFIDWTDAAFGASPNADYLQVQVLDGAGNPVTGKSFTVHFQPFTTLVVLIAGHTQQGPGTDFVNHILGTAIHGDLYADPGSGSGERAEALRKLGYDVIMFAEDPGNTHDLDTQLCGTTDVVNAIESKIKTAVNARKVTNLAFIGYSHGGGLMHDIINDISDNHATDYASVAIPFTAYIDAIQDPSGAVRAAPAPEQEMPKLTTYHMNFYESDNTHSGPWHIGDPVGGPTVGAAAGVIIHGIIHGTPATDVGETDFDATADKVLHYGPSSIDQDKDKTGAPLGIVDAIKSAMTDAAKANVPR